MVTALNPNTETPATGRQRVITLVHGTWARNAAWVKDDSKFCRALVRFEPDAIIQRFQWSGRNSHHARLRAAEELTKQLGDTFAEYPEAEHHLIAHSHGGNVVLYALRGPSVCERIATVICLATPFIHAQARPLEPAFLVIRALAYSLALAPGAILVILSLFFALLVVQADPDSPFAIALRNTHLPAPVVLVGLAGLSGVLLWGGRWVARRLSQQSVALLRPPLEHYQQTLVNDYNHRAARPVPVLNAQVERDEPALWLRALRWVSEPQGDSRATITMAAMFALSFGAYAVWEFIHDAAVTESPFSILFHAMFTVAGVLLVWLVMLPLLFVIAQVFFIAMPLLFRAHGGGFGEWSLFANWLVLIQAHTAPAGGYRLEPFRIAARGKGLRHSQVYEDDRVIARIGTWLANHPLNTGDWNRRS